jgi:hypothetical protein
MTAFWKLNDSKWNNKEISSGPREMMSQGILKL